MFGAGMAHRCIVACAYVRGASVVLRKTCALVHVVGRCEGAFGEAKLFMLVCSALQSEVMFLTRCVAFAWFQATASVTFIHIMVDIIAFLSSMDLSA